jgi:glycosyltransferase involved in cell wall biosynthesis
MKIAVALFVYNEKPYLANFIRYYRSQGCSIIAIDNYSNDGTYELLIKNRIPVTRKNTNQSFQLRTLQDALMAKIAAEKPDWVVYTGADLYYSFDKPIKDVIMEAEKEGYNQIAVRCLSAMNTGEKFHKSLQNTYHYGILQKDLIMISKYTKGFYIIADSIQLEKPKVKKVPGIVINYGACKPLKDQIEKLKRRQKAWDEGMHKGWGTHYLAHKERKWIWTKKELTYFPTTPEWKYIQKIMLP